MLHSKPIIGTVRGNSIELVQPLNLPDGASVEIVVRSGPFSDEVRAHRLGELFGCCREDATDLDAFLNWNAEHRKLNRPELPQ